VRAVEDEPRGNGCDDTRQIIEKIHNAADGPYSAFRGDQTWNAPTNGSCESQATKRDGDPGDRDIGVGSEGGTDHCDAQYQANGKEHFAYSGRVVTSLY
jgi:hypothetical protein